MGFTPKIWQDRVSEYPTRRLLTYQDTSMQQVTVQRDEGVVSAQGDSFTAANMNGLESRIGTAFSQVNTSDTYSGLGTSATTIVGAINEVKSYTAPNYDTTAGYERGDLVFYQDVMYMCTSWAGIPAPAGDFDAQYWQRANNPSGSYMRQYNPVGEGSMSISRGIGTEGASSFAFHATAGNYLSVAFSGADVSGERAFGLGGHAVGTRSLTHYGYTGQYAEKSVAIGGAEVDAPNAFAFGDNNVVNLNAAHSAVYGHMNNVYGKNMMVFGLAATEENNHNYIELVGNGETEIDPETQLETVVERSNARTLDWNGNEVLAGKLTIGGTPSQPTDAARLQDLDRTLESVTNQIPVNVPHNTPTNVYDFKLSPGTYMLHVVCRCTGASAGRRHLGLFSSETGTGFYDSAYFAETDSNAIGDETITLNLFTLVKFTSSNQPVYVRVTQTNQTNATITVTPRIQYVKIG